MQCLLLEEMMEKQLAEAADKIFIPKVSNYKAYFHAYCP